MFATHRFPVIYLVAAVTLTVAGCGQKGPLFMPVTRTAPIPARPGAAPSPPPPASAPVSPAPVAPDSPAMTPPAGTVVPVEK